MRAIVIVVGLLAAALLGLGAYAYLGDMAPNRSMRRVPVDILTGSSLESTPAAAPETEVNPNGDS